MRLEDLGLIGNCQCSAHVDRDGSVVWACLPRFDSPPVFGALLDDESGGRFRLWPADDAVPQGVQRYLPNTNILETRFDTAEGSFRVLDFFPRFMQHDRSFRPTKLLRIVEPISGAPRLRAICDPVLGWSKEKPRRDQGSHHVSYLGYETDVRLTTDIPLSYLDGRPFTLTERRHFVFSWGSPVEEPLRPLCDRFLDATRQYWERWVKHCEIPPAYQEEVIRSALALKLHCFEDTGAIVAAMTTSIPESPGSGRTWDYRYCWLRDSYYALGAFRLLGHFEEREQFAHFLVNVAAASPDLDLAPLYRIDGRTDLVENILPHWKGYRGEGPVRVGNQAAEHLQFDVFGEMVMALAPIFLDARFRGDLEQNTLDLVIRLARKAISVAGRPDAGIWEFRTDWRPQTFSTLMCWAATDRMARIAERHAPALVDEFRTATQRLRAEIVDNASDPTRGNLVATYGGREVDAALLQAVSLHLLPASDPRMHATIDAVRADLLTGDWLRRYRTDDGFGVPEVAFVICTYWLVEALATVGRLDEARAQLEAMRLIRAPLGLIAEDVNQTTGEMWGNYPQAYSHVGLIHAAFAASPKWHEIA